MSEISFSPEQAMLLDIASKFCRDRSTVEDVRAQLVTDHGYDSKLWDEMVELEWLGMAVPEEHGGTGMGLAELVTLVEPMGRHLLATPFVTTQIAIQALVSGGSQDQQSEWLSRIAQGTVAATATQEEDGDWDLLRPSASARATASGFELSGRKCFVLDAKVAELLLVSVSIDQAPALVLLERDRIPEGALEREVVIDETRRSYRLCLDGIEVAEHSVMVGEAALSALQALRDAALLLIAAEACGGTAGALGVIVEYLKERTQFGRPIGSYQALKHPTVDVLIGLERARSHLYHAASVLGQDESEVALRMAKSEATDAFAFAGDRAIQFHGGFGFTYECDAQLFLRRALWCQYQFGDAAHHRKHLAESLLAS